MSFDEEKRSCVVNSKFHSRYHMSEMAGNALFEYTNMYNVEWRFDEKKIGNLSIYCALPLFLHLSPLRALLRSDPELMHYSYAL